MKPIRRIFTAGEIDDGKSTLIGRIFLDLQLIHDNQLEDITSEGQINLAHFTDGLKDERAGGITIDVAYRYFETSKNRFILADAPGHLRFLDRMLSAASQSEMALILVDATRGVTEQTRRHAWLSHWLGLENVIFVINKMDACHWNQKIFQDIKSQLSRWPDSRCIPVSALQGDNVIHRSSHMPWYSGQTLAEAFDDFSPRKDISAKSRLPVQSVHPEQWVSGSMTHGALTIGSTLHNSRTGEEMKVEKIFSYPREVDEAKAGNPIRLKLSHSDLKRGDVLHDGTLISSSQWEMEWVQLQDSKQEGPLSLLCHTNRLGIERLEHHSSWCWNTWQWDDLSETKTHDVLKGTVTLHQNLSSDPSGKVVVVNHEGTPMAIGILVKACL